MSQSTITAKGQTTIPQDIRRHLKLQPGDRVTFIKEADGTARIVAKNVKLQSLAGVLKADRRLTIEEINEAAAEHVADHVMHSLRRAPK